MYEPHVMRKEGIKHASYWCWQGYQAGYKMVHVWNDERHAVVKLGWRVEPNDKKGENQQGKWFQILKDDASFAGKAQPYRKG